MSHVVVIGSGIAGLTTALRLARTHEVTVVTKDRLGQSNTALAQGGIAGVLSLDDTIESHVADTLAAGAGLSDEDAAWILCTEGPERILELVAAGVAFDLDGQGHWAQGLEGAHSIPRILHSGGDATGEAIVDALRKALRTEVAAGRVNLNENTMLIDLITSHDAVHGIAEACGVMLLHDGEHHTLAADAVVLATGGAGQLYPHTTNPPAATGDGLAAAIRAGAAVADMEFYQFHPTALAGSGFLISEAVRGAGAILLDAYGHRFMAELDRRGDLAPRDVVALAIHKTMAAQNGESCYLDARAVPEVAARFPSVARGLAERGFDLAADLIPITPAAHYFMGGIATDLDGRTTIDRLFAVGEVACTGVHGANRLASNSLLEGAVFGVRAAAAITADLEAGSAASKAPGAPGAPGALKASGAGARADSARAESSRLGSTRSGGEVSRDELHSLTWANLGVERDGRGLQRLLDRLDETSSNQNITGAAVLMAAVVEEIETANLALIAGSIAAHALAREESRGAHTRTDFPTTSAYTDCSVPIDCSAPPTLIAAPTTPLLQETAS